MSASPPPEPALFPLFLRLDGCRVIIVGGGEEALAKARLLAPCAANITVIIITHRMGILAATSKIAIMQDGAVSAFGDSQEIFDRYLSRPHIPSSDNAPAQVDVSPEPRSRVRRTRKRLNALAAQSDGPAS